MSWIEVTVGGVRGRAAVVRSGEGLWVSWRGRVRYLGPERASSGGAGSVEREVRAPMTGRVLRVSATKGAAVKANDVLVVLEAMKMEYRLVSPRDGTLESVACKEGDRVDLGQVVATLAP